MAIKMVSLKCPNCNSNVMVEKGRKSCFCTYCGAQLFLDDGSVNININHNHNYTYRSIDETGIRKAELEADLQKRKLNKEDREDKLRHMGIVFWTTVLLLICLGGPAALLLFPSDSEKQHKRQVAEFEQLVQEIEVDIENKNYDSARIKANKIHLELLSFTKDEIKKRETNFNKNFSISKKENSEKKEENNDNINIEQNPNVVLQSNNSDTDDSDIDSSDISSCEEEILI